MSPRSREEVAGSIVEWIEDLGSLGGSALIIVEGKRDLLALDEMGIKVDSAPLNLGMTLTELVESIYHGRGPFEGKSYSTVVILTDWDRRGGRLAGSLEEACRFTGIRCDLEFRKRISIIAGRWVKDVESVPSLMRSLTDGSFPDMMDHPDGVPSDPGDNGGPP